MQSYRSRILEVVSHLRNKVNLFYVLSFAPLSLIAYYDLWILAIAIYGFIFLLLKSRKLRSFKEPPLNQRILGLLLITSSFFAHYIMTSIVPTASYYGIQNYLIFLFGLFLIFFKTSALKEAFTPVFFMTAATSSSLAADWLKPYLSPYLGNVANLIAFLLRAMGVRAYIYHIGSVTVISILSLTGRSFNASFLYECLGIFGALVFSIIFIIVLLEDQSSWKIRLVASTIGIIGTFALNIARITIILLVDFLYGAEVGAKVHYVIGYVLFSVWLTFFLYAYSKRETIQIRISSLFRKQSRTPD
jgi:exosortase/archaeosortase family protein